MTYLKHSSACCFTFLLTLSISLAGQTEDLASYKARYPDESVIYLKKSESVTIDIKNGELDLTSTTDELRYFLDDKAGIYGSQSIQYSGFNPIQSIEAATLVPNGKKFKRIKVDNFSTKDELGNAIFHDDVKSKNFIYPSLQEGAQTSMVYTEKITEPRLFGSFFFGSYIPVEEAIYTITCHKDVSLAFKYFAVDEKDLNFTKTPKKDYIVYQWTMKNVPAMDREEGALDIRYRAPHIIAFINTYQSNGQEKAVLKDVADLYRWYYGFVKDVNQDENTALKQLVDSITADANTDMEKVKRVYYWVQDNIKYIAFEDGLGGFIPRTAAAVCEKRFGDCKDMSSIITEMLDLAGVPSHLTWIGTRDIPYSYSEVPTPMVDNHMIATYIEDGQYYFLDATGQHYPFGLPSSFIQGKEALIGIDSESYEIKKVPEINYQDNMVSDSVTIAIEGDKLVGKGTSRFTGYYKINMTNRLIDRTEKEQLKSINRLMAKGSNKSEIESFTEENLANRDADLLLHYDFNIRDYAQFNNDEIYVNLHLERPLINENIQPGRKLPLERKFKSFNHFTVVLDVPEGYTITYVPENESYDNEGFGFDLKYNKTDKGVTMDIDVYTNHLVLDNEHFEEWNDMIKALKNAYKEVIILKKKA